MITDLSRVHELKVLERARLQALMDELHLTDASRVDAATGARSGRLMRAAQVVQGVFNTDTASQVRLDATIVRASDAQVTASGSGTNKLKALFDLEKVVVLQLVAKLGITLTPAERVAISERPTKDLVAFLLYSRGLESADDGDFTAAADEFNAAAARDPGFTQAVQQAAAARAAQVASATSATGLAAAVTTQAPSAPSTTGALGAAINAAVPSGAGQLSALSTTANLATPASDPNRVCEGATCDGPARAALVATVTIILKLP
jgi:TolB-like protein